MYGFILNMWCMKKIDETKVRSYVPFYITTAEADAIIATPQWDGYSPTSAPKTSL